jgi:hypothetical protein
METTEKSKLVKAQANIELMCDTCSGQVREGETYFYDPDTGKIYCSMCKEKTVFLKDIEPMQLTEF